MKLRTTIYRSTTTVVLIALLLLPLGCNSDDAIAELVEDVCFDGRAVLSANRSVSVDPSYDGGTVEGWFTMARGFVNAVKKENLPYGTCTCTCVSVCVCVCVPVHIALHMSLL